MFNKFLSLVVFFVFTGFCFAQSNFSRGEEFFLQNNPQQAVTFLERAFAEDQRNTVISLYLGYTYEQLGRMDEAIAIYRRILPTAGNLSANVATNLGNLFFNRSNNEEAEKYYTQAIGHDSEYSAAYLSRGNTRVRAGNIASALSDYEHYIFLEPQASQRGSIEQLISLIRSEIAVEEMRRQLAEEEEARRRHEEEEREKALRELHAQMNNVNELIAEGKVKLSTRDLTGGNELFAEARRLMPTGESRFEAQKLSEIADAYYDYAANNPDTLQAREAVNSALSAANDAVAKDSSIALPHYIIGKIARDENQNEKALNSFREASRLDPNNFMYSHDYGRMLFMARRFADARDAFIAATRINPNFEPSWYNLGGSYRALNNPNEALAAYRRAAAIKPDYAAAHREIGRILLARNDARGAVDAFARALQHNPDSFSAMRELADAHSQAGNFIDAENVYTRALTINPDDPQTNHNMALVKIELEKFAEALNFAGKAAAASPSNAVYIYTMGLTQEKNDFIDRAISSYKTSAQLDTRYIRPRINLGNLLAITGNYTEAISFLNEALGIAPEDYEVNKNLGVVYSKLENWRNSISYYERALAAKPNDVPVLLELSRAYASSGDQQKAVTSYQQVLRIQSNNWDAMFELGKLFVTLGRFDDAKRHLQDLINRNPGFSERVEAERILRGL